MANKNAAKNGNGGNLGFEAELFKAADKLRGNMEPADYKHVVLGLIFLKYISDAFEAKHQALLAEDPAAAEDRDEYLADNIFWVPKKARWSHLQANAKKPTIGTLIDDAMRAIEKENESLKGVLPKDYARPALNKVMLGELIDLISGIALGEEGRNKNPSKGLRDRRGQVLFIDARNMGVMVDRTRRELTDEEIKKIADTYHAWRGEKDAGEYADVPGFCKSATLDDIRKHDYVLTPGRYVGAAEQEDDGEPFSEKMARLAAKWREQRAEAARLDAAIETNLREFGYGG